MMRGVVKSCDRALRHGSDAEQKGASSSADFMKCAGEGEPHFIKCGFGEVGVAWEVAC